MLRRVLLAAVLAGFAVPAWAADPVKVGVIFPQSGGAGRQGQMVAQSIQAMATMINEAGGVLGRPIEILVRDDESTPAVGVAKANELAAAGVAVVIEGWNSPVTLAEQPILARAGVLDITAISKADGILASASNPLAIRLNSSNAQDADVIVQYLAKLGKKLRIGFITQNDAYGNGAQQGLEAGLKQANVQYEIVTTQKFPFPQTDFRVEVTSLKDAKPDVVIAINANEGAGLPAFLQQYAKAEVGAPLICSVGTVSPSVIEAAGPSANGVLSADIYFPDAEPFASNAANKAFMAQMKKQFGLVPDKYMAIAAASLQVWAKAVESTKSLERKTVAEAIRGHTIAGTLLGDAVFSPTGQLGSTYAVFTVKDGKIVAGH
jgi:branched-chain amino acid transport system substrate-binding protein